MNWKAALLVTLMMLNDIIDGWFFCFVFCYCVCQDHMVLTFLKRPYWRAHIMCAFRTKLNWTNNNSTYTHRQKKRNIMAKNMNTKSFQQARGMSFNRFLFGLHDKFTLSILMWINNLRAWYQLDLIAWKNSLRQSPFSQVIFPSIKQFIFFLATVTNARGTSEYAPAQSLICVRSSLFFLLRNVAMWKCIYSQCN